MEEVKKKGRRSSGGIAIFCGSLTVILGIIVCSLYERKDVAFWGLMVMIILNLFLHAECYINNKKSGKRQENVLTITIVELFLLVLFITRFFDLSGNLDGNGWLTLMSVYVSYLVFNGASLMAFPIGFAKASGVLAVLTGVLVFVTMSNYGLISALCVGFSIVVNGAERVGMSLLARAGKYKSAK